MREIGRKCTADEKRRISLALTGRKHSEMHLAKMRKPQPKLQGKNHYRWKGGITPLHQAIRNFSKTRTWRMAVFNRDSGVCFLCFKSDFKMEVHHVKPFRLILKEFLSVHSNLDPIKDKQQLMGLAKLYGPFWDVSNGQTLCIQCHGTTKDGKPKHSKEKEPNGSSEGIAV